MRTSELMSKRENPVYRTFYELLREFFKPTTNVVYATYGGDNINFVSYTRPAVNAPVAFEKRALHNFRRRKRRGIRIFEIFVEVRLQIMRVYPLAALNILRCSADNFAVLYNEFTLFYIFQGKFMPCGNAVFFAQINSDVVFFVDNYVIFHNKSISPPRSLLT